jgi:hypothetical protein
MHMVFCIVTSLRLAIDDSLYDTIYYGDSNMCMTLLYVILRYEHPNS